MNCDKCHKSAETKLTRAGNERIPKGWKRAFDQIWCQDCWHKHYVLRAITIPVVKPLGTGWPELRESLAKAWSESTAATNWIMTELYARDEKRHGQDRMPRMPKIYLYPEIRSRFDLPSSTASSMENSCKSKYAKKRKQVMWTCQESLPNAKYPQPVAVPSTRWKSVYAPSGKNGGDLVPCVQVPLDQTYLLQLRGGQAFRRQMRDFKLLVDGKALKSELQLLRKRVNGSSRRSTAGKGRDSGGQQFATRLMCKMVGWFPRSIKEASGTMHVRSDTDCFLIALDEKAEKLRIWNADHIRRRIAEHRRKLQRLSDDQKAEQRPKAKFQSRREYSAILFRNRIKSFIQETAAQLAGVASRMKFSHVKLDITEKSYFGEGRFDWSSFVEYLKTRLDKDGITLEMSGKVEPTETMEPLTESQEND